MQIDCPKGSRWNAVLALLGDKWTLIVIRDIMVANRRHFDELLSKSEEGISAHVLENRLNKLVERGLVVRTPGLPGMRHKHQGILSLTERSIQLVPVMIHICSWGSKHCRASDNLIGGAAAIVRGGPRRQRAFMQELRRRHLAPLTGGAPTAAARRPTSTNTVARTAPRRGGQFPEMEMLR